MSATVEWVGANAPARVGYGLPELGPTLWAPLRDGRAELSGLRFGTGYRVWAGDAAVDLTTAPAPDSPTAGVAGGRYSWTASRSSRCSLSPSVARTSIPACRRG